MQHKEYAYQLTTFYVDDAANDAFALPGPKNRYKGSLIVPVLNESARIALCLNALQDFRLLGWKVIVVDGGSTDLTLAHCRDMADVIIQTSAGRANQMNVGVSEAEGEILVFLHADTELPTSFESDMMHFLRSDTQWGRFDVQLTNREWPYRMIAWFINHRSRLTSIATGDQVLFFRSTFFQKIGGYPLHPLMEDIAICKRSKGLSNPFNIDAKVTTSSRRWEQHGVLKTIVLMWGLRMAFAVGVSAERLHRIYYRQKSVRTQ